MKTYSQVTTDQQPQHTILDLTSSSALLPFLNNYLPYTLPLLSRLLSPNHTLNSRILTSFPIQYIPASPKTHFAIAYLDRSGRPETECWIFLADELPNHKSRDDNSSANPLQQSPTSPNPTNATPLIPNAPESCCLHCRKHLLHLLHGIATLPTPPSTNAVDPSQPQTPFTAHITRPTYLVAGSLSAPVVHALLNLQHVILPELPGYDTPYAKYLFRRCRVLASGASADTLPPGLSWGTLRAPHLDLVRAKTHIPRQAATLARLRSVGVFPADIADVDGAAASGGLAESGGLNAEANPVAWGFVGVDGSLTSLHVEEEWRGKGVGLALARRLLLSEDGLGEAGEGQILAHADVAVGNQASRRLMERLGGETGWTVWWLRVDLGRVKDNLDK